MKQSREYFAKLKKSKMAATLKIEAIAKFSSKINKNNFFLKNT
jgi:hypothetical protein